jgi:uncharacterized protein YdeI (YjbR/CyaY-like superfamily)
LIPDVIEFPDRKAWAQWLDRHCASSAGVWVRLAKKSHTGKLLEYPDAIEEAIAYGWIDGQKRGEGATTWLQRFTPRGPRSIWSKINCGKAESLIDRGLMKPSGLQQVERAKADGRWERAYDGAKNATVPPDLEAALKASPKARSFFQTLDAANRYAILWRIQTAKKPETRAARIERFVAMCARGEKIHPHSR